MKRTFLLILILINLVMAGKMYSNNRTLEKKGILLVAFGTSYSNARKAYQNIEEEVKKAFPEVPLRWAYTSKIIRKKLAKQGEHMDSPPEALARMGEEGFSHVAVQSLHIIPGEEYENLKNTVMAFNKMPKGIDVALLGKPLLFMHEDNRKLAGVIHNEFSSETGKNSALVMMGHGTHHQSNIYYAGFQMYLNELTGSIYLGTVEGYPELSMLITQLKERKIEKVSLLPFMSVAGDHAQNDMAGSEKESWKSVLEDEGFQVKIILRGLAEYDDVVKIWISHLKEAWNRL
jgi:sirohydrochlorin cobaltochelatase